MIIITTSAFNQNGNQNQYYYTNKDKNKMYSGVLGNLVAFGAKSLFKEIMKGCVFYCKYTNCLQQKAQLNNRNFDE